MRSNVKKETGPVQPLLLGPSWFSCAFPFNVACQCHVWTNFLLFNHYYAQLLCPASTFRRPFHAEQSWAAQPWTVCKMFHPFWAVWHLIFNLQVICTSMLRAPTVIFATARLKGTISSYLWSMQSSCSYHIMTTSTAKMSTVQQLWSSRNAHSCFRLTLSLRLLRCALSFTLVWLVLENWCGAKGLRRNERTDNAHGAMQL